MSGDERKAAVHAAVQRVYVVMCDDCGEVIEDTTFDFESEAVEMAEANQRADGRVLCNFCAGTYPPKQAGGGTP